MSVGLFSTEARRSYAQSNSATRRRVPEIEPRSVFRSSRTSSPERRAISAQVSTCPIGPEVDFGGLPTRIGYVLQTITTLRTRVGATPASARQPLTVVSREVT